MGEREITEKDKLTIGVDVPGEKVKEVGGRVKSVPVTVTVPCAYTEKLIISMQ
jgi:hypothetical protein